MSQPLPATPPVDELRRRLAAAEAQLNRVVLGKARQVKLALACLVAGGHLLLVSRRFPAAWGVRLPDLASRLKAAPVVEIGEPDDMLLAGVITKLFADRQVAIEPLVVQYLVRRIERSLATAMRVVEKLDRRALEEKTRITRPLAASVLDAMDAGQGVLEL